MRESIYEWLRIALQAISKRLTSSLQALKVLSTRCLSVGDKQRPTMKTIEVEDDVYQYIAAQTKEIGEPATSILRRLLGVPKGAQPTQPAKALVVAPQPHELAFLLGQPLFSSSTTAVARMLRIFKEAHAQKLSLIHISEPTRPY